MLKPHWINWSKPILLEAANWLFDQAEADDDEVLELGDLLCVVPGQRASRMLLAVLVEKCQSLGKRLNAPDIHIPKTMVDALLPNRPGPVATDCERVLAWMKALKRTSNDDRSALLPHPPELGSFLEWHYLAKHLVELHQELVEQIDAADTKGDEQRNYNVFSKVAEAASLRQLDAETLRWISIGKVYDQYLLVLREANLVDPFEARWEAIRKADSRPDIRIVLIGVVDLNQMQRSTLLNASTDIDVLTHAHKDFQDRFDELGCLIPSEWEKAILPIEDERIIVVDRDSDQAQAMLGELASLQSRKSPQQITIGLGDESLSQTFLQAGKWANVGLHWAKGEPVSKSPPYRLLEAAAAWLKEPRFAHLASMLRHSDLEHWLIASTKTTEDETLSSIENWQTILDDYFTQYLQEQFTGDWLGSANEQTQLKAVYSAVCKLMAPLSDVGKRPMGNWCSSTLELLSKVYSINEDNHANESLIEACTSLRDICNDITSSKKSLQEDVDGATAISFILAQAATKCVTPDPQRNDIEMLGWLELHFDPAPVLIVAGFNEGFIPDAVTADVFLPDTLRKELGILNNDRRYARDAYYLQAMLNSRAQMKIILGQSTTDGDPLTPSRLLMACEDSQLASRVNHLTASKDKPLKQQPWGIDAPSKISKFTVTEIPSELTIPDAMRVTWFRDYLNCPYRFALDRLEGLESKVDNAVELDAMQFGTLAHDVLCSFGENTGLIDCDDEKIITTFLFDTLSTLANQKYGSQLLPAVRVQLSRMRQRLEQFALLQSNLRKDGWRICNCEFKLPINCTLDIPGEDAIQIKGRIDRIDQHQESKAYRLIDYKTGDTAKPPTKTHKSKGKNCYGEDWVDVQLPLYGHLASVCGFIGEIELAYINLPKDPTAVDLYEANWSQTDLNEAIDTARRVVRDIRKRNFKLNLNHHPIFDEFARICQTTTYASIASDGEGS